MRLSELERLRKDLLSGEEAVGLRESSLELGLNYLRLRRRRTRIARGCAVIVSMVVLGLSLYLHFSGYDRDSPTNHSLSRNTIVEGLGDGGLFVTDEELFSLFPDRSMALIGKSGQQEVVFLDSE